MQQLLNNNNTQEISYYDEEKEILMKVYKKQVKIQEQDHQPQLCLAFELIEKYIYHYQGKLEANEILLQTDSRLNLEDVFEIIAESVNQTISNTPNDWIEIIKINSNQFSIQIKYQQQICNRIYQIPLVIDTQKTEESIEHKLERFNIQWTKEMRNLSQTVKVLSMQKQENLCSCQTNDNKQLIEIIKNQQQIISQFERKNCSHESQIKELQNQNKHQQQEIEHLKKDINFIKMQFDKKIN